MGALQKLTGFLNKDAAEETRRKNLTRQQRNAEDLKAIFDVVNRQSITIEDVKPLFQTLITAFKEAHKALKESADIHNAALSEKIDNNLALIEKKQSEIDKIANTTTDLQSSMEVKVKAMFEELEDELPEEYDDEELRAELIAIKEAINSIPKYDDSELRQMIKTLEEKIDDRIKRLTTTGGVTNARIIQSFKYILKTEEPVGAIDGVNTTYTLSQPIFAILSMSLNGETIAQIPNYTIAGNTFTFSTALPGAYSGKDWEVKYI